MLTTPHAVVPQRFEAKAFTGAVCAMAGILVASNILVQFPVMVRVGRLDLADILTYGAFTFPAAFLVTDLVNRLYGVSAARRIVIIGLLIAVPATLLMPYALALLGFDVFIPARERFLRIALASGGAFLLGQLLDVFVFDKMRRMSWWRAPLVSSTLASFVDTLVFFTLAFSPAFLFLGANDDFALESVALLGVIDFQAQRWASWAFGDFFIKIAVAFMLLAPYRLMVTYIFSERPSA